MLRLKFKTRKVSFCHYTEHFLTIHLTGGGTDVVAVHVIGVFGMYLLYLFGYTDYLDVIGVGSR